MTRKRVLPGKLVAFGAFFYLLAAGTVEVAFAYEDERDGQVYFETKIGEQVWMTRNMNWSDGGAVGFCPTSDPDEYCDYFGRLYTWDEARDVCPIGWHLPTRNEWIQLKNHLGGNQIAGKFLKSADVNASYAWKKTTGEAGQPSTDDYGFTALPGGWMNPNSNALNLKTVEGVWWTDTPYGSNEAYRFYMSAYYDGLYGAHRNKNKKYHVRCVEGYVDDRDGQVYQETRIGEQIWMTRNMSWSGGNSVGYCSVPPAFDTTTRSQNSYCNEFGRLYTWNEAQTVCPSPWRLPGNEDWVELRSYLERDLHGVNYAGRAGMRLKATDYDEYDGDPAGNETNEFGFNAIPSGYVLEGLTALYAQTSQSSWWTSTDVSPIELGFQYYVHSFFDDFFGHWQERGNLHNVRCVRKGSNRTYEVDLPGLREIGEYLSKKPTSDSAAQEYAEKVNGPNFSQRRLSNWKGSNGFNNSAIPQVRAVYYNGSDLGFGRDMVCNQRTVNNKLRVACYVSNYGFAGSYDEVNGKRLPASTPEEAFADVHAGIPFATVAMEYLEGNANPVRFFVFGANEDPQCATTPGCDPADGKLQTKAALDSGGPKNVPGICLSCHGGTMDGSENVAGAHFLPFDPFSFEYDTGNPATGQILFPEHEQRAAFKELNAIVYDTEAGGSPIRQLIEGLYGGDPSLAVSHDQENVGIPDGFSDPPDQNAYRHIVKPYCRGCHVAQDRVSYVATQYSDFTATYGCTSDAMPHAEHTDRRFLANLYSTEPGQYSTVLETLRAILNDPDFQCGR